jgi:SRSO17 transposase
MQLTPTAYEPNLLEKWRMEMVNESNIDGLLKEYTYLFCDVIKISNQRVHFENYLRGLMSELPRKSVEPIALAFVGENGVRSMQQFMKRSPLDDGAILNEYQNQLALRISSENGMLSVDGSDSVKKERARQAWGGNIVEPLEKSRVVKPVFLRRMPAITVTAL